MPAPPTDPYEGVRAWAARRRYTADQFDPPAHMAPRKGATSTAVVIPTKECADTIGAVLDRAVAPTAAAGLLDDVVLIDAGSSDGTAEIAAARGARVLQQDELMTAHGPTLGKGDALWRAIAATTADVVVFIDGDTADPVPAHVLGLLGPLLSDPTIHLVKGAYDRPLRAGQSELAHEGGRVTELMARPLLNAYEPRLSGFAQPLAGEFAARRPLLESISFPVGYGVEIAVLLDAVRARGLDALAECHIGTRRNRHQPLRSLGEMAYAVLAAVQRRSGTGAPAPSGRFLKPWQDFAVVEVPTAERPPLAGVRAPTG